VSNLEQPSKGAERRRGFARLASFTTLAMLLATGCNETTFLVPPPTLRGIAIPLPPPSFADQVLVHIDVEGSVPVGFQHPATQAFLYEKSTARGYFAGTEDNEFTIYDVLVDIDDNCLETWFVDGVDGEESSLVDFKVILVEDAEACAADLNCSPVDDVGACLCLEKWTKGC
jgi:hypothetical protein